MIRIKKGQSKQSGLYNPLCFSSRTMKFSFTKSCKYSNTLSNPTNIQKLMGVALFHFFGSFKTTPTKKWWELHKWLSIRCGWRWSDSLECFELMDYSYIDGIGDRLGYDKLKVRVVVGDVVEVTTRIKKDLLELVINHKNQRYIIQRHCKTPKYMLLFLRLRAYIEPKISTKDFNINTF